MGCPKGKISYASFEAAKGACGSLARMNYHAAQKAKRNTGVKPKRIKVRAYICPECGQWHVGRGPRGSDADWHERKVHTLTPKHP